MICAVGSDALGRASSTPCPIPKSVASAPHHGQVAEVLADLAASLRRLQRQPLSTRLLASLPGGKAAVVGAVAGRGEQARLVKFLPLAHLYVPKDRKWQLVRLTRGR